MPTFILEHESVISDITDVWFEEPIIILDDEDGGCDNEDLESGHVADIYEIFTDAWLLDPTFQNLSYKTLLTAPLAASSCSDLHQ